MVSGKILLVLAAVFIVNNAYSYQPNHIFVRIRRDTMNNPLFRVRRAGGYASASSHASASASSSSGGGPVYFGGPAGAGAQSFASSSSSSNAGNGGNAYPAQGFGGLGYGHDAGYQGPVLFSRFGEAEGTGVHVSGQAQGNKGAFASSSSSVDNTGKITYSVQSGKY